MPAQVHKKTNQYVSYLEFLPKDSLAFFDPMIFSKDVHPKKKSRAKKKAHT